MWWWFTECRWWWSLLGGRGGGGGDPCLTGSTGGPPTAVEPCCRCGGGGTAAVEELGCRTGLGGKGGGSLPGGGGCCAIEEKGPPGEAVVDDEPAGPPPDACGRMTGNLMGSESGGELAEAAEDERRTGVEGPDMGELRPMGEVSGESLAPPPSWSELLPTLLPRWLPTPSMKFCLLGVRIRGSGLGWFFPGRFLGLMPGVRRFRPFHLIFPSC